MIPLGPSPDFYCTRCDIFDISPHKQGDCLACASRNQDAERSFGKQVAEKLIGRPLRTREPRR